MRELTCIVCPIGCSLSVEEGPAAGKGLPAFTVTGNRCPRGAAYAQEEIRAPKRVITATCGITFPLEPAAERAMASVDSENRGFPAGNAVPHRSLTAPRRLPVKTSAPCPKEKIDELLGDIYRLKVCLPVKAGHKLITDWKGSGIDVIAVRTLE